MVNQAGFYGIPRRLAKQRAEKYLKQLSPVGEARRYLTHLSGGMKRRLMIARALVHEPKLLILDEPTAGVDIEIRRSMWAFLRKINKEGISIILTTHYLEEAENLCRRVAIIDHGTHHGAGLAPRSCWPKLHTETFVLNLRKPLEHLPEVDGYAVTQVDDTTLEVEVSKTQDINALFSLSNAAACRCSACATRRTGWKSCSCASSKAKVNAMHEQLPRKSTSVSRPSSSEKLCGCCASGCRPWCRR